MSLIGERKRTKDRGEREQTYAQEKEVERKRQVNKQTKKVKAKAKRTIDQVKGTHGRQGEWTITTIVTKIPIIILFPLQHRQSLH
jgi:hypothetical protein